MVRSESSFYVVVYVGESSMVWMAKNAQEQCIGYTCTVEQIKRGKPGTLLSDMTGQPRQAAAWKKQKSKHNCAEFLMASKKQKRSAREPCHGRPDRESS